MNIERLIELITQGESLNVEFKGEEGGPLSDRDLIETVICMANRPTTEEAFVLVGVEDDGRVSGPQAYRLLGRLVKRGFLEPDAGRGRGVGYKRCIK
jgi:predicted HTH transcriptional regulator